MDKTDITHTAEGAALGTPLYFAPEQFNGTKYDIEHRTDLFAIGIIIYEALVGLHPFFKNGMNYNELATATSSSDAHLQVPDFTNLDRKCQMLVARLLEKQRARRPASAGQVASILRKIC